MKNSLALKLSLGMGLLLVIGAYLLLVSEQDTPPFKKPPKQERIAGRYDQEFLMTRDPVRNIIPVDRLLLAYEFAQSKRNARAGDDLPIFWEERGPNNVGGRTRGLIVDLNDPSGQTVWAGGVAGGLWRTNNIDDPLPFWVPINDLFENLAVSTIAQDPSNPDILYFGTGECWFNFDAVRGLGAWISTDGGANWNRMPDLNANGTSPCIAKMMVDANGVLFAATTDGLRRFNPVNNTWPTVLGANRFITDLEIAANGDMYAAIRAFTVNRSTDGGDTWNVVGTGLPTSNYGRVELACAPSNANVLYVAFADTTNANSGNCLSIFRTANAGGNWNAVTCPPGFGNQAWYDLILAVDPGDANRVWAGGVPLCLSSDGGLTWTNFGGGDLHVDHHAIVYYPNDPDQILFGNDGGVYKTYNGTDASPAFADKNNTYNVTQFYAVGLHPDAGSNYMLGGTQDNATPKFTAPGMNATTCVLCCCDGGWAFIDADDPSIQIASVQNGSFSLSTDGGNTFSNIVPSDNGRPFITPAEYDSDENVLYYSGIAGWLGRVTDVGGANTNTNDTIPALGGRTISAFALSPSASNRIFVGTSNAQIYQIDEAHDPGMTQVTSLNSPVNTGWVSCVEVDPNDEEHIVFTLSNYGVNSIWETTDKGLTWTSVEGDFPDIPVRWFNFWPGQTDKGLIATELGVWYTKQLNGANTVWYPTNEAGLANCRVDMLRTRASDKLVVAATHGRGMYSSDYFTLLDDCQVNLTLPGNIASGLYMASEFISSDGTVGAERTVIFQAGEYVELLTDFTAERGSNFWALIKECMSNPMPLQEQKETIEAFLEQSPPPAMVISEFMVMPNPARTMGTAQFTLTEAEHVRLYLMNTRGELVSTLASEFLESGQYQRNFEVNHLPGGIYLLVLKTNQKTRTERVVVVK
jgi:photosystem II stability/assembly factor-like uncharacterized protein